MGTKHLDAWANNKSQLLAVICQHIATSAETCFQIICVDRGEMPAIDKLWPIPVTDGRWLMLYRNHRRVIEKVIAALTGMPLDEARALVEFQKSLVALSHIPPEVLVAQVKQMSSDEQAFAIKAGQEMLCDFQDDLREEIATNDADVKLESVNDKAMREWPEVRFFMRVSFPCWIEFGQTAAQLIRKARQGDLKAIEAILRLDKGALEDRRIRQYLYSAHSSNRTRFDDIAKAIREPITKNVTIGRVKMSLAGCISAISHALKQPLTEPEIRALFDAVVADSGMGAIDNDLPESPEAFSQAILRYRRFWNFLFEPRQKFRGGLSG